jgi:hypothetical protein
LFAPLWNPCAMQTQKHVGVQSVGCCCSIKTKIGKWLCISLTFKKIHPAIFEFLQAEGQKTTQEMCEVNTRLFAALYCDITGNVV